MADPLQEVAERIGTTKSHIYYAAREGKLISDRWRARQTDEGITVDDTHDVLAGGIEPGVYPDMTNEEYHGGPGISSSQLKRVIDGAPIKHAISEPNSDAFRLGTLVHLAVLEPDEWRELRDTRPPECPADVREQGWRSQHHDAAKVVASHCDGSSVSYALASDEVKREVTKAVGYKKETSVRYANEALPLAEFYYNHGTDFTPVDRDTVEQVEAMRDAVLEHPAVDTDALAGADKELSVYWHEDTPAGKILCKCRVDALAGTHLQDLKTTRDASPSSFSRSVANFGYHTSASYYSRGLAQQGLGPVERVSLLCVEKSAPYLAAVYELDEYALAQGREMWQNALNLIAAHLAHPDAHAGYSETVQTLSLPGWSEGKEAKAIKRMSDRTAQIMASADNPFK
jgi:exodeoxyribonuclease VIII